MSTFLEKIKIKYMFCLHSFILSWRLREMSVLVLFSSIFLKSDQCNFNMQPINAKFIVEYYSILFSFCNFFFLNMVLEVYTLRKGAEMQRTMKEKSNKYKSQQVMLI